MTTSKKLDIQDEPIPLTVTDRENWRPIPEKKRHLCSLKGIEGFGNFVPLWTNGVIVQVRRHDGSFAEVHLENVEWPSPNLKIDLPKRNFTVRARRKGKTTTTLLELEMLLA